MYEKIIEKLKDKNIAILGFGQEGKSTYHFIRKYLKTKKLTILDQHDILSNNDYLKIDQNVNIVIGEHYLDNLEQYDLIIKTPGIALLNINTNQLKNKLTSQLELILEINKKNIIGITGTKGKSTTSSLLYTIIKEQNENVFLLGNIGKPIFDYIEQFNNQSLLVIEMSSHQLEYIKTSPHIGVILNLYQDHIDHTGTLQKYYHDKMNIIRYQDKNDIAIYDGQNKYLEQNLSNFKSHLYTFKVNEIGNIYIMDNQIYYKDEIIYDGNQKRNLIGIHNLKNIMVALLICKILNLDIKKAINSINRFTPLEHRLEKVGTYNDITYYNDSIATIPEATINGIKALQNVDTLIFGGLNRNIDYQEFIDFLRRSNISNLIGLPDTGHIICNILKEKGTNKNIYLVESIDDAIDIASKQTKKKHICLLSPAAASYNKFKNFEEKGNYYKNAIKNKYKK